MKPKPKTGVETFGFDSVEEIIEASRQQAEREITRAEVDRRLALQRKIDAHYRALPDDWLDKLEDAPVPRKGLRRLDVYEDIAFVYFVQAQEGGPVKIGTTIEAAFWKRLTALQIGHPDVLVVRRLVYGGFTEESLLHILLADHLHRGEWFRDEGKVAELIRVTGKLESIAQAC